MGTILDRVIKYSLYLLVFLLPLFFLPYTLFPIALNKQILSLLIVFLVFVLWLIKTMSSGKIILKTGKLSKIVLLTLVVLGISTIFSGARNQSFWGTLVEPDTFLNLILYCLSFFLFANLLEKEEIQRVISIFLLSSGILTIFFWVQPDLNPMGTVQALSVFLGGALVILMAFLNESWVGDKIVFGKAISKKFIQVLLFILGVFLFWTLLLVGHWVVWLGIVFATSIIVLGRLYSISGPPKNILKNLGIPLIVLVLALVFIFIEMPFGDILNILPEITPSYKLTFDIALKTLQESPKNFIFGSGPATFGYQYSLHRTTGPNLTDFWQIRFLQGAAAIPTFLATFGILGSLAILLMIIVFFWQGFKFLIGGTKLSPLTLSSFVGGFYFLISWFFYPATFSLMFTAFLMMGLWIGLSLETAKEISFYQSPQKTFFVILLGILLTAGIVVGFYRVGRRYVGAVKYAQVINFYNQDEGLNKAIIGINEAAGLNPEDSYFRSLSQLFLVKSSEILNNLELSQEEQRNQLQQSISSAENSALAATRINPRDSLNWLQLGTVYENIVFLTEEAGQLAVQNYQKTRELDPQNPQIPLNLGRVYLANAQRIQQSIAFLETAEEKDEEGLKELQNSYTQSLGLALQNFEISRDLKRDFSSAYYLIAQTYELQGENNLALENYQIVLILEPWNKEVKEKIETLEKVL